MSLADKTCKPCHGGVPALKPSEYEPMLAELQGWKVIDGKKLQKTVKTKDFAEALNLANKVGAIAEEQQHHPDLLVRWGEVVIELWTHAVDGLTESDFILAAKINRVC